MILKFKNIKILLETYKKSQFKYYTKKIKKFRYKKSSLSSLFLNISNFYKVLDLYNIILLLRKNWNYWKVISYKNDGDLNIIFYLINKGFLGFDETVDSYKLDYYNITNYLPKKNKTQHIFLGLPINELFYFIQNNKECFNVICNYISEYHLKFVNFFLFLNNILKINKSFLNFNLNCIWEIKEDTKLYYNDENNYLRQYLFFDFDIKELENLFKKLTTIQIKQLDFLMNEIINSFKTFEVGLNNLYKDFFFNKADYSITKNKEKLKSFFSLKFFDEIYLYNYVKKEAIAELSEKDFYNSIDNCKYDLSNVFFFDTVLNKLKSEKYYNIIKLFDYEIWYYSKTFIKDLQFSCFKSKNVAQEVFIKLVKEEFKFFENIKISSNIKKSKKIYVEDFDSLENLQQLSNFKKILSNYNKYKKK